MNKKKFKWKTRTKCDIFKIKKQKKMIKLIVLKYLKIKTSIFFF